MSHAKLINRIISGYIDSSLDMTNKINLFSDPKKAIPLNDLEGDFINILGIRGSGKSNTCSVFLEEAMRNQIPFCVIDTNNEYSSLRNYPDVGKYLKVFDRNTFRSPSEAKEIAKMSLTKKFPIIIECGEHNSIDILYENLTSLLHTIYDIQKYRKSCKIVEPYYVIIEEAHLIIPQRRSYSQKGEQADRLREITQILARTGRKYGIFAVLISQRSQDLDKGVISQSSIQLLHRVSLKNDLEVYEIFLKSFMSPSEIILSVPSLQNGECYYVNKGKIEKNFVRLQLTEHIGATPEFRADRSYGVE